MQIKHSFTENEIELSHFARALALPIRIAIITKLVLEGDWAPVEAFQDINMTPVCRDNHLKALLELGILKDKHYDRKRYFAIDEDCFLKMRGEFNWLFETFVNAQQNRTGFSDSPQQDSEKF